MRWIIEPIRRWFCQHDWEMIQKTTVYREGDSTNIPIGYEQIYICKKCIQKRVVKF